MRRYHSILPLEPSWITQMRERVGIEDLRSLRRQRQGQQRRDIAHARADEQAADVLIVHLGRVQLNDRGGNIFNVSRGADSNIAGAGPCGSLGGQRDRARHLAGKRVH